MLLLSMTGSLQTQPLVWCKRGFREWISQSKVFYCILGAQINAKSSILAQRREGGGGTKQAQSGFLVLMDYVIRQPDLAQIVGRYQQAMVSLNLAVWPGAWRMPARMIINTESTVGYNNKLKQTVAGMKLAINNEVNPDTQKSWP